VIAGELYRPFGPCLGRVDHARPVRVVPDQVAGYGERRPVLLAAVEPAARLGQHGVQPVPFGVGLLGQPAQVDRQRLGAAHQRGERGGAERRVGVAVGRRALHVRDQPGVRRPRGGQRRLVRAVA
jgi:hypothetical protein